MAYATLSDWLIISGRLSVTRTRQMANYISQIGSAVGFVALGFVGCDHNVAIFLIITTVMINTTSLSGYLVRLFELHYPQNAKIGFIQRRYTAWTLAQIMLGQSMVLRWAWVLHPQF